MLAETIGKLNVTCMTAARFFDEIVLAPATPVFAAYRESFTRTVDTKDSQSGASADRMLGTATKNA
ncbi:hypothetical protein BRPE64_ACDS10590 [Caballeronia insecticola]|uniref:Uncharacterized protein n=1 Tax=Caballeronia insecticola TaxID=758793 RepID=R4WG57_9BURK|nr:hypothetical protein BRPE64_ACDS10590 [Caballeronia insecticola]